MKTCIPCSLLGLASVGLFLLACGPEGPDDIEAERAAVEGTYGEILLVFAQDLSERSEDEAVDPFSITARFLRVAESDRGAASDLLGEDIPEVPVPLGECTGVDSAPSYSTSHEFEGALQLLDAGELVLRDGEDQTLIPDWSFPSVFGVVAGVLYGGDAGLSLPYRPGGEYRIASTGSQEIGAFEATVLSPEEITGLYVGGAEVGVEPVRIEDDTEMRWDSSEDGEEILIEVTWTQFGLEQTVACRSADDGSEELPAAAIERLDDPGVSDARLIVSRVSRRAFAADGLDDGEALFVVSLTVPLRTD